MDSSLSYAGLLRKQMADHIKQLPFDRSRAMHHFMTAWHRCLTREAVRLGEPNGPQRLGELRGAEFGGPRRCRLRKDVVAKRVQPLVSMASRSSTPASFHGPASRLLDVIEAAAALATLLATSAFSIGSPPSAIT